MSKGFKITKGIYVVPGIGRQDCTKPVSNKTAVALYLSNSFPFISLAEDGVALLKKEKLTDTQIANLILKAKSANEVDLLLKLSDSETLVKVGNTRKKSLLSMTK